MIKKSAYGVVTQIFDDNGKFVSQSFSYEDEVGIECLDSCGRLLNTEDKLYKIAEKCDYLYDMIGQQERDKLNLLDLIMNQIDILNEIILDSKEHNN